MFGVMSEVISWVAFPIKFAVKQVWKDIHWRDI